MNNISRYIFHNLVVGTYAVTTYERSGMALGGNKI